MSTLWDAAAEALGLTYVEAGGFPCCSRELTLIARPKLDAKGFYRLLDLTPDATDDDIRKTARSLLKRFHPDGTEPDREKFEEIEQAYRTLSENRVEYDAMTPAKEVSSEQVAEFRHIYTQEEIEKMKEMLAHHEDRLSYFSFFVIGPERSVDRLLTGTWLPFVERILYGEGFRGSFCLCVREGEPVEMSGSTMFIPRDLPDENAIRRAVKENLARV